MLAIISTRDVVKPAHINNLGMKNCLFILPDDNKMVCLNINVLKAKSYYEKSTTRGVVKTSRKNFIATTFDITNMSQKLLFYNIYLYLRYGSLFNFLEATPWLSFFMKDRAPIVSTTVSTILNWSTYINLLNLTY